MDIEKVVIPVAGLGTRLLPATKSQPKEMLPVGRKPVVQYVVEEAIEQGLKKILFITGRDKRTIEDHFDRDPELHNYLSESDREDLLDELTMTRKGLDSSIHARLFRQAGQPLQALAMPSAPPKTLLQANLLWSHLEIQLSNQATMQVSCVA